MTPMREQQMAGLTRDYEQSKKNYEQLLAKRDQSGMATDLEKQQQGEQFRVLDPPNLPQKPFSPNRLKLDLIGLVAGLMVGVVSWLARRLSMIVSIPRKNSRRSYRPRFSRRFLPWQRPWKKVSRCAPSGCKEATLSVMAVLVVAGFASTYLLRVRHV